jgi:hypothetical protein
MKNEEKIKDMIVDGHKRGVCDSSGASIKIGGVFVAKPITTNSAAKTYVFRDGKIVPKEQYG